jgi:hypothetical protein
MKDNVALEWRLVVPNYPSPSTHILLNIVSTKKMPLHTLISTTSSKPRNFSNSSVLASLVKAHSMPNLPAIRQRRITTTSHDACILPTVCTSSTSPQLWPNHRLTHGALQA